MTKKNSKWLLTKARYKMCEQKGNEKRNHCKNVDAMQNTKG